MTGAIHFAETGEGAAVLLLHAFPLNHTMWTPQIAPLRRRRRIVTPDFPGFGSSPLPAGGWRIADAAGEFLKVVDALALDRFAVVGLSMGAYAAFELHRLAGERVAALVLANARARADTDEERQGRAELAQAVRREGVDLLAKRMMPRLLAPEPDSTVFHAVRTAIEGATPQAAAAGLEALAARRDSTPILGSIRCPVLVIGGAHDAITPSTEGRSLAQGIPNARFVEIPHAGHLTNLENPDAFNREVEGFLDSVDQASEK